MLDKFLSYINQENLIKKDQKILLAVSGGLDSMVMADLFLLSGMKIGIGHINHHLRAQESDGDAKFVHDYCMLKSIPFYQLDINPDIYESGNMHQQTRVLRYDWLHSMATIHQYDLIATAHHHDDAVETFMINFMRGSGLDGLDGISVKNGMVIRPLLFAYRNEISVYATKHNISYREDSSNATDKYLRNKIRHHVLPIILESDARARDGMGKSIKHLQDSKTLLDDLVLNLSKTAFTQEPGYDCLHFGALQNMTAPLLYQLLKKYGFNFSQCEDIVDNRYKSGSVFICTNYEAIVDRERLMIRRKQADVHSVSEVIDDLPYITNIGPHQIKIEYTHVSKVDFSEPGTLWLDAINLTFPLTLRSKQDGDVISPLGMEGKKQKLKEYLINKKVSVFDKENILVLEDNQSIMAILMIGISQHCKITDTTTQVIKISKTKLK